MAIQLVTASLADVGVISDLACRCFTETFGHLYTPQDLNTHLVTTCSAAFFAKALDEGNGILLALDHGAPVGYAKYGKIGLPIAHTSEERELHRLYVLASHHRQGIGQKLMLSALDALKAAPAIYLGVWEENLKAQAFYSRYSFEIHAEYTYYVGNHADRELIMRKSCV